MFSTSPYPSAPSFQAKYISTHKRAKIVRLLLLVGIALSAFTLLFNIVHLLAPGTVITDETSEPTTIILALMEGGVALMEIAVYIATIVFFLMWMYRSYENLPAFGVPRASIAYSSGWAVGSFFVPIVSLFIPYQAMRELWRKSVANSGTMFSLLSPPAAFPIWWAFWLLSNIAGNIYLRLSFNEQLSSEADALFGAVTSALSIVAAIFAIMVVGEIDQQQTESAKLIGREVISPQPPLPDMLMNPGVQPQPGS